MRTVRGLRWCGVGLGIAGFGFAYFFLGPCGCGGNSGYDPAARYTVRTDPLVIRTPLAPPNGPAAPGALDASIAAIPALGGAILEPKALPENQRIALTATLETLFGTPAAPIVDHPTASVMNLSAERLSAGAKVYTSLNCNQCHGLMGDGRGPTGPWVYPYPRDFRTGHFKVADGPSAKPSVSALARVIREGVPNTSMQQYDLISDDDLNTVTAYVIHLSIRGEVEYRVLKTFLEDGDEADDVDEECREKLTKVLAEWQKAQNSSKPLPEIREGEPTDAVYQERIRRGFRLFVMPDGAGCMTCHQDFGRHEHYQWDVWGTPVRPSNLTVGEYRWGKKPEDTATRIRFGILAANMPAHPYLSDDQLKALTLFVRAMPNPARLPPDVRSQVYPGAK